MDKTVLLLRTSDKVDKYELAFSEVGLHAGSVPILDFEFCNQELVKEKLSNLGSYSGVIFTSQRAVEALESGLCEESKKIFVRLVDTEQFFVFSVGRGTADCIKRLGVTPVGEDSGNAKTLCEEVIKLRSQIQKPLLFMRGNLAYDTVPEVLSSNGFHVECLCCYKTIKNHGFDAELRAFVEKNRMVEVVVFFSPSGVEFFLESIGTIGLGIDIKKLTIVAIGQTTKEGAEALGLHVNGTASKPTPQCLVKSVQEALNKSCDA